MRTQYVIENYIRIAVFSSRINFILKKNSQIMDCDVLLSWAKL